MKKNFTFLFTLLLAVVGVRAEVAADLAGKYFTAAEAATSLQTDTWYLLKNQGRGAYISEESDGLKMKAVGNVPQFAEATANAGVLFKLASGENEGQYSIISGNGNYLTFGSSSSAVSATPVNYIINSITEGYWYMQDPTTNIVADGNAAGGTFVGWGTSVPTSASGNNVYQFLEVSLFDAAKMTVLDKAANMAYDLQIAYGLVTDASKFSSNAPEPNEGSFGALIDGEYTSFFHSAWSYNIEGAHHLQAEVSKPVESFFFFFKKRSQNNNNRPTDVTILGSNDGEAFTEITTISTGFPVDASDLAYTSAVITAQEAYKHFRFVVNATNSSSTFFTFSEFYLLPADKAADLAVAQALVAAGPAAENFDELAAEFETVCNNIQNQKIAKMYADAVANAEAIVAAASHADVPVLGQYPTYTYNVFKAAIDELKGEATQENLDGINAAIAEFEATKNLPMFTINSLKDYAVGQSIYENENGGLNFKATDATDKSMLWAFDMTATEVGLTDKVVVRNVGTGNLFWGTSFISVIETEPAVEGDGVFMFKTEGTGAPVHAQQSGSAIVRWSSADANTVGGASTWTFTYVGNTYELLDLPQEPEHDEADYDLTEGTWSDATTYLVNPDFASIEGWTVAVDHVGESYGGTYYKLDTGTDPNTIEVYHTWGGTSTPLDQTKNFKISQKVMLPAGIYCLKANGFYREGAEQNATTEKAWIFAGESTQNLVGIGTCGANNMGDAANVFKNGGCLNEFTFTVAEDGEVEIGFQGYINTTLSWVILGPVTLEKKVTLKDNFMEQAAAFTAFGQSSMALYSLGAVQEKWAEAMAVVDPLYGALAEGGKALKTEVVAAMELMTTTMAEIKPVVEYYDGKFTDTKWAMYDIQENSTANSDEVRAAFDDALAAALNVSAVTTVAELEAKVAEMEAARQAYVLNAVPAEGFAFDYTFKVMNPDMENGNSNWEGGWGHAGTTFTNGDISISKFTEKWVDSANGLGNTTVSQTIKNLPSGVYSVTATVNATRQNAADQKAAATGVYLFGNENSVAVATYDGKPEIFTVEEIVVVAGELTIGIKCENAEANWVGFDNVRLAYTGSLPESVLLELKKEVFVAKAMEFAPAVESFQLGMIATSELYPVLEIVQSLYENLDNATLAELEEAITAMDAATALMNEANDIYAEYKVFVNLFKDASEMSEPATMEAAELLEYNMYGTGAMMATSVNDLAQKVEWIKEDYLTYVSNAYTIGDAMFDVTLLVANAEVTSAEGWTNAEGRIINNTEYTGAPDKAAFDAGWWAGVIDIHQVLPTLPAGNYVLSAVARSASPESYLYAKSGETEVKTTLPQNGDQGGELGNGWANVSTETINVVEGESLTIGVYINNPGTNFAAADNFKLYYSGKAYVEVSEIYITPTWGQLYEVGQTVQLTATINPEDATDKTLVWSSDVDFVTVDENGLVTVVAPGEGMVTITATASNGVSGSCYFSAYIEDPNAVEVTLNKWVVEIEHVGETFQLVATVTPADADVVITWSSSKEAVATVDENGLVTAVGVGEADIIVYVNGEEAGTCWVEVLNDVPDGIDNIEADSKTVIYDLSGRRVNEMTKGIYIVNGKKVIKK